MFLFVPRETIPQGRKVRRIGCRTNDAGRKHLPLLIGLGEKEVKTSCGCGRKGDRVKEERRLCGVEAEEIKDRMFWACGKLRIDGDKSFDHRGKNTTLVGFGLGLQDPRAACRRAFADRLLTPGAACTGFPASPAVFVVVEDIDADPSAKCPPGGAGAKALVTGLISSAGLSTTAAVLGMDLRVGTSAAVCLSGGAGDLAGSIDADLSDFATLAASPAVFGVRLRLDAGFATQDPSRRAFAKATFAALFFGADFPASAAMGGRSLQRDAASKASLWGLGRTRGFAKAFGTNFPDFAGLAAAPTVPWVDRCFDAAAFTKSLSRRAKAMARFADLTRLAGFSTRPAMPRIDLCIDATPKAGVFGFLRADSRADPFSAHAPKRTRDAATSAVCSVFQRFDAGLSAKDLAFDTQADSFRTTLIRLADLAAPPTVARIGTKIHTRPKADLRNAGRTGCNASSEGTAFSGLAGFSTSPAVKRIAFDLDTTLLAQGRVTRAGTHSI